MSSASSVAACAAPRWHTVFELNPSVGCPGDWVQVLPRAAGGGSAAPAEAVCSRGFSGLAQVSAMVAEGWTYNQLRGSVSSFVMGSPDALRLEPWRGEQGIDDAYLDGISLTRWTSRGREHVASYIAGLSYSARHFSYYATANCICHGGVELPPSWLGDDYYCDSALRGGPLCGVGLEEDVAGGCRSNEDCVAKGCGNASFFQLGAWYNRTIFDQSSRGYLCRGARYATDADFAGRPFGSFYYSVPGEWANDPIEARIMAGQAADDGDGGWGNEEVALRALTLEVFGCASGGAPRCGDGIITAPEQCDNGVDAASNASLNGYGRDCSLGCTSWNPAPCRQAGTCVVPPPPPPVAQDLPGKQEVGATELPAWITIADVDFDALLSGAAPPGSNRTAACVHCAPPLTIAECPGVLTPFLHPSSRRFFCAAPLQTDTSAAEIANFYVALPKGSRAVGFRGRVVTVSRGQLDGFFNSSWVPLDYSPVRSTDPAMDDFTTETATYYPNVRDSSIEGRYVDGLSLTVDCSECEQPRQHVFTLAAGTTYKLPAVNPTLLAQGDPALLATAATCAVTTPGVLPGRHCFLGNCACHSTEAGRNATLRPYSPQNYSVLPEVGDNFYCDAGGGPDDDLSAVANTWKNHQMFKTNTTCASDGEAKSDAWWAARGGPGFFLSFVETPTVEPLEVRLMMGKDSYYENLGITEMYLEACVCRDGQPRDECVAMCQGVYVECALDRVSSCTCEGAACSCTCKPIPRTEVRLGVLLPMFASEAAGYEPFAWSPRNGVLQAIREVNDKTDGVADDLLPNVSLVFRYMDSKCDSALGLALALRLTRDAFDGKGVDAIIGAGCSGVSQSASQVAGGAEVPIISPSSTSPALSDGSLYPYFLRTVPSDAYLSDGMVKVLTHLFEYTSVALVSSSDVYAVGGARAFAESAQEGGLQLSVSINYPVDAAELTEQFRLLASSSTSIIVLYAQAIEGARFVRGALDFGLGGSGYLWMFGEATLQSDSLWDDDPALRQRALRGSFTVLPLSAVESDVYRSYVERRLALVHGDGVAGNCSRERDSEGAGFLYGQPIVEGGVTRFECAEADRITAFDSFGYDAVLAVAHALHLVLESQEELSGPALLDALVSRVRFDGVSGTVSFFDARADPALRGHGDRRAGVPLSVQNYVGDAHGLVEVGVLAPCDGAPCGWLEQWQPSGTPLTFSTEDNSRPPQRANCPFGEVLSESGLCTCDDGFELTLDGTRCERCPAGQYSLRSRPHAEGSGGCTMCAEHFYRPAAHLSAAACTSCAALAGVYCPLNATVQTIVVNLGWWRLSPHTTKTYRCDSKENTSSCVGGIFGDESCAPHHAGPRCKLCLRENQYFDSDSATCQECPDTHGTAASAIVCVVALVFAAGLFYYLLSVRAYKQDQFSLCVRRSIRQLKAYNEKVGVVMKLKIAMAFAQVVAALDSTYSIGMPRSWFEWTAYWRVIGEVDWIAWVVPPDCVIGSGMVSQLCLRALAPLAVVVALPLCGASISFVRMCLAYKSKSSPLRITGTPDVSSHHESLMKGAIDWLPASLVVSFCFTPSVSSSIFRAWNCVSYSYNVEEEHAFLAQDLSVRCDEGSEHDDILMVAWAFVVIWPIGMVLMYAAVLVPCRTHIRDDGPNSMLLRSTAFLHRDYIPEFYWWEVASLLQRTTLTGWLLLIDPSLPFIRLVAALIVTIAFMVAVLACAPYKRKLDHYLAAACQLLLTCMFIGGIMVKLYTDISTDSAGSPELAYRFLGLHSEDSAVAIMIAVSFAMLVWLSFALLFEMHSQRLRQQLKSRWSVVTMDPPSTKWKPRAIYACFLSHYKMEAGSDARYIHDILRKMIQAPVFLDSSALNDLRDLIKDGVYQCETLLLLASKHVLTRPWCLIELLEATRKSIPIVILQMSTTGFTFDHARRFVNDLEEQMQQCNPQGLEFLRSRVGSDMQELKLAVLQALDANEAAPISFCSHAGDSTLVANMKDVVERLASVTNRTVKWSDTSAKEKPLWTKNVSVRLSHSFRASRRSIAARIAFTSVQTLQARQKSITARMSASRLSWSRVKAPEIVNKESAIFITCARNDAASYARALRSKLEMRLGRGCAIGGGEETASFVPRSFLMVVLLTKNLLSTPAALYEIWLATQQTIPIVTVALSGGGYDYENASTILEDLASSLDGCRPGKLAELQERLPVGFTVQDVGNKIQLSLTTIIALSWSPASDNQLQAVVNEIISRVPRKSLHARHFLSSAT